MADRQVLELERREVVGKKVARLRRSGVLPATVYGKGVGPFSVQVNARTFSDLYRKVGRTALVDLKIPGQKTHAAFIHAVQRHPVTRDIIHADFRVVDLRTEITVDVPVHLVGESELVRRGDAIFNQALTTIALRALPTDLPPHIEVDVSGLDSFDKSIHVRDLTPPEKTTFATDEDELVVSLTPARATEEEEAAAAEEATAAEPELVREKREEAEEDKK
jgi:large subunit ribosomal protein L25